MPILTGKGAYLWQIWNTEGGDPQSIADLAEAANFSHILIKIADGVYNYNVDKETKEDYCPALIEALKARGIQAWGWHYVYGAEPQYEAFKAVERCQELGVDGYVIDAESEYNYKNGQAETFMNIVKNALDIPIALSSFRWPSYHNEFPWTEFLRDCDLNMPQVYWVEAHNAGDQVEKSYNEFVKSGKYPDIPFFPTIAVYKENTGWAPTLDEVKDAIDMIEALDIPGFNFWELANARKYFPEGFDYVASYQNDGFDNGNYQNHDEEPEIPTEPELEEYPKTFVTTTNLNMRYEPDDNKTESTRIGTVAGKKEITVTGEKIETDKYSWVPVTIKGFMAVKRKSDGTIFLKEK